MFRKAFAGVVACVMAVGIGSALPAAGADSYNGVITNATNSDGGFSFDLNYLLQGTDYTMSDIYGAKVYIEPDRDLFASYGAGGCVAFNGYVSSSQSVWASKEWGDEGAEKEISFSSLDNSITTLYTSAPLSDDYMGNNASIDVQLWWGADITIKGVDLLGSGGTVLDIDTTLGGSKVYEDGSLTAESGAVYTKYTCDLQAMLTGMSFGYDDIYGLKLTFECTDKNAFFDSESDTYGAGGEICLAYYDGSSHLWVPYSFQNVGADSEADFTINTTSWTSSYVSDTPLIDSVTTYARVTMQQYWGTDLVLTKVQFLDANGDLLVSDGSDSAVLYDLDNDGDFDGADIKAAKTFVLGKKYDAANINEADANADGVINAADVLILMRHAVDSTSDKRIYVNGTDFVTATGEKVWMNGVNTPWDNWNDFGGNFDSSFWSQHFAELKANGANSTRIWFVCSCDNSGVVVSNNGATVNVTTNFWNDCDEIFRIAEENGIYIMATVMSFDCYKNTYSNYENWRGMINSTANIDNFVDTFIVPFAQRYADCDYLWAIDLCNEPEWAIEGENSDGAYNNAGIRMTDYDYYFAKASAAIHENSEILVTVGFGMVAYNSDNYTATSSKEYGNHGSDANLQSYTGDSDSYLDFYSPHYYSWQDSWMGDAISKTPEGWGLDGTKPVVLGEFPAQTTNNRTLAQMYEALYNNGYNGALCWTSNGVDSYGGTSIVYPALKAMYAIIPELIFPFEN
ncbi:MAG: dockerin type I repeat-containing protein [Oscillospiraceae bacterium]|nr:dockerin type I repeat-containing protein [Oscillospiraceae bacterium]